MKPTAKKQKIDLGTKTSENISPVTKFMKPTKNPAEKRKFDLGRSQKESHQLGLRVNIVY